MWIDRAVKWLLPREEHFFDLIERGAARAYEISALLVDCCAATSHTDREAIVARIHKVEHEADRVIAEGTCEPGPLLRRFAGRRALPRSGLGHVGVRGGDGRGDDFR